MKIFVRIIIGLVIFIAALGAFGFWFQSQLYLRIPERTLTEAEYVKAIEPEALKSDLDFLIAEMETVHPNLYAYTSKEDISAQVEGLKTEIDGPMTRLEFYRHINRLNELFVDGHTWIRFPSEEWRDYRERGGRVFPLAVAIKDGSLYAVSDAGEIKAGEEIVSINGKSAREVVARLLKTKSGELMQNRVETVERSFSRVFWYQYGPSDSFVFEIRHEGGSLREAEIVATEELPTVRTNDAPANSNTYSIEGGTVGILHLNTLDVRLAPFREYLKEAFTAFSEAKVQSLIIDLRDNGGGLSDAGDVALRYLTPMVYSQTEKLDVKVTEQIQDFYRNLLPAGFKWFPLGILHPLFAGIYGTDIGEIFTYHFPEPYERSKPEPLMFRGDVYLLISARTYSAATMLAATIEHYDLATVIGEETGEPTVFYGDNYYFYTPNSVLQSSVSHKRFYLPGGKDNGRGVIPDITVSEDRAYQGLTDAMDVALTMAEDANFGPGVDSKAEMKIDYAALADRVILTTRQLIYDPRLLKDEAWGEFERRFRAAAAAAETNEDFVAAFHAAKDAVTLFSHFDIRTAEEVASGASGAKTNAGGPVVELTAATPGAQLLTIRRFLGDDIRVQINTALDAVLESSADHLIIDLRSNPGGDFSAWPIVARVTPSPLRIGALVSGGWFSTHDALPSSQEIADYPATTNPAREQLAAELFDDGLLVLEVLPEAPRFGGKISVLIDGKTASTSEIVAASLQNAGLARVYGARSAGEVLNAQLVPIPDSSFSLVVPVADVLLPDGRRLEGAGVVPDVETDPETALEAALGGQ